MHVIGTEIFTSLGCKVECWTKSCECMEAVKAVVLKQIVYCMIILRFEQHFDLQIVKYIKSI
jgi:hypothetical protein